MRLRKLPIGAALLAGLFLGASASGATPGLSLIRDMTVALPSCGYPTGDCHTYKCNADGSYSTTGNRANGTTCNDLDACTTGDKCQSGECVGTPLAGINDGNVCTADSCNASTGAITHTPLTNACCSAGTKLTNICCNAGLPKANGAPCDNATLCDGRETCQAGVCTAGTPVNVDDGNACTFDSCDAATGAVTHTPITGLCCNAGTVTSGQYCGAVGGAECACSAQAQCLISKGVTRFGYDGASSMTERTVRAVGQACAALP
jgi:Dictyostelium (slime mold) repeat